jgi:hypothetical protein
MSRLFCAALILLSSTAVFGQQLAAPRKDPIKVLIDNYRPPMALLPQNKSCAIPLITVKPAADQNFSGKIIPAPATDARFALKPVVPACK